MRATGGVCINLLAGDRLEELNELRAQRVLGIVVLVVKFLLLELFLLVARELEDAARGLGV